MAQRQTIVRKCSKVSKASLHAMVMVGWQRAIGKYGKGAFADELEISTAAIDKQLSGSMPGFEHIVDAICFEPHILDEVAAALGKQWIDVEGSCTADDMNVLLAKLLLWLAQAEHPESPGGKAVVHSEIAHAEQTLRDVHKLTGELLSRLTEARLPRAVA